MSSQQSKPPRRNTDAPNAGLILTARAKRSRNIADLRSAAARRLPKGIFDFIDGGAEDEVTLRENQDALRSLRLIPRVLRDVSEVDMRSPILGQESPLPFAIGPTGGLSFVWPRGDLALAKAAEAFGVPFTLATTSAVSIEDLREKVSGRLWLQSYIFRQREFTQRMIARARNAEYEALMITVDLPVGGNRERDYRNDFSVPFRFTAKNVVDFARHPEWVWKTLTNGGIQFGNLVDFKPGADATGVATSVGRNYDPSFDWEDLKAIRDSWPQKLIVKGIAHPEDAERLASLGVDALVVSNHGGRQLDGAVATAHAFSDIHSAVGNKAELYLDGGIRRGSDMVKALALGADAVLVGRATLYGAAAAGERGAMQALTILQDELARTMRLCGSSAVRDIDETLLCNAYGNAVGYGKS